MPSEKEQVAGLTAALPNFQTGIAGAPIQPESTESQGPIAASANPDFYDAARALTNAPRRPLPVARMRKIDDLEVQATISDHALSVTLKGSIAGKGDVSASVHCVKPAWDTVMAAESSHASGGTGPIVYDIAMEFSSRLFFPLEGLLRFDH